MERGAIAVHQMLKKLNEAKKVEARLRRSLLLCDEKLKDAITEEASAGTIDRLVRSKGQCADRLRRQSEYLSNLQVEARGSWM